MKFRKIQEITTENLCKTLGKTWFPRRATINEKEAKMKKLQ